MLKNQFLTNIGNSKLLIRCFYSTPHVSSSVDKQLLSKLRKSTGFPFINCKKALEKFHNNIKNAEKWLREEAQKEGWSKASKLQSRPMSHGLLGVFLKGPRLSLVEINCETDFVSKNKKFQSLVSKACQALFDSPSLPHPNSNKGWLGEEELRELKVKDKSLGDLCALEVGDLGENIRMRRGLAMAIDTNDKNKPFFSYYVHTIGPKIQNLGSNCILGKYAAVAICGEREDGKGELKENHGEEEVDKKKIAKHICQHIVGMNPVELGSYKDLEEVEKDEENENKEKDFKVEKENEIKKEKKNKENVESLDNIGDKSLKQEEERKETNETKLLVQKFMLNEDLRVGEVLLSNNLDIIDFVRVECGEELREKEEERERKKE